MVNPICPECGVEGIEHIISDESKEVSKGGDAWFNVAFCNSCGHVYGIFSKTVSCSRVIPPQNQPLEK